MKTIFILLALFLINISSAKEQIAIIDSGIDTRVFPRQFICEEHDLTHTGIYDTLIHGTIVAGLIAQKINTRKYCFNIIKIFDVDDNTPVMGKLVRALQIAYSNKDVKYVNLSLTGRYRNFEEEYFLTLLLARGVKITVAAGNEGQNLEDNCNVFPGCYWLKKGFYVVESINQDGSRAFKSNYGGPVNAEDYGVKQCYGKYCGSGTSFAAPNFLSTIIK